jgi:hypothetical protein
MDVYVLWFPLIFVDGLDWNCLDGKKGSGVHGRISRQAGFAVLVKQKDITWLSWFARQYTPFHDNAVFLSFCDFFLRLLFATSFCDIFFATDVL